MIRPTTSVFPENIDARACFSDISLEHADVLENYSALVKNGNYREGSALLDANKQYVDYYGADMFNLMENRVVNIEDYVINTMEHVDRGYYGSEEPIDAKLHSVWMAS